MIQYASIETQEESPHYDFINKFKQLWELIDTTQLSTFIAREKEYDLYPLRKLLQDSDDGYNRFNMDEMADAGEAYGEFLDIVRKDLRVTQQEKYLKEIVGIPIEKHFTCV